MPGGRLPAVSSRLLAELWALVAPPRCVACARPLERAGDPLCSACRRELPWLPAACPRCALPAPCAPCPARRASWDRAWAPLAYEGPARELVTALKFRGALSLAATLAAPIAARAPDGLLAGATLVPVPLAPRRRRARGFNQAERLAAALASRTGLERWDGLRRDDRAEPQAGTGRRRRLAAARIEVRANAPAPASTVLVDDVHTTGATLEACAAALRRAGSDRVCCATFARTLDGRVVGA
jgi:ComF family protein